MVAFVQGVDPAKQSTKTKPDRVWKDDKTLPRRRADEQQEDTSACLGRSTNQSSECCWLGYWQRRNLGAVAPGRTDEAVRKFETYTPDLRALADWLKTCGVDTVAMESTGVYWIPVYEILEERGFQVFVVNARHLKNVPGRKSNI